MTNAWWQRAWKTARAGCLGLILLLSTHCGGSTSGSGGVTVNGRLIAENSAPVVGVTVTDLSTGDADLTDETGTFGLLSPRASSIALLFEGQGLSTQAALTNLPPDTERVTATFRARLANNLVEAEEVVVEQKPQASSSSSSKSNSASSSASTSSAASSVSAGTSSSAGSSSSLSDEDESSSSSSDDDESSSSNSEDDSSDSASSDNNSSNSSNSSESSKVERTGPIEMLSSSAVVVGGITFVPQTNTEYRDENGNQTTLSTFSVGDQVKARGQTQGSTVALTKLEID
jgi:hypothetical protein